jgi:hypothetical protein
MVKKLRLGVGAKCSVMIKYLRPSKLVKDTLINRTDRERVKDLLAIRKEVKRSREKEQMCAVFRHSLFENKEIYAVLCWVKVEQEGPAHSFLKRISFHLLWFVWHHVWN